MADETEVRNNLSTATFQYLYHLWNNEICWINGQKVAELQAVMRLLFAKKMDRIL